MAILATIKGALFGWLTIFSGGGRSDQHAGEQGQAAVTVGGLLQDPQRVIIDVRTQPEFIGGHVPGALNVPLDTLSDVQTIVSDKAQAVVVYCRSGARSGRAERQLRSWGYTRVINGGGVAKLARTMNVNLVGGPK